MAGYWPSSFFLRFIVIIMDRDKPFILTEQAWSIKDLLYGQKITPKNFAFAGTKRVIPAYLARSVANQNTGFASCCPLAEPVIY